MACPWGEVGGVEVIVVAAGDLGVCSVELSRDGGLFIKVLP